MESDAFFFAGWCGLAGGRDDPNQGRRYRYQQGIRHVQVTNAKFRKPRTVVLMPQVAKAMTKQLSGRSKGWLFSELS